MYKYPPISLLQEHNEKNMYTDETYVCQMADKVSDLLKAFKVSGKVSNYRATPFAACFDIQPDTGVTVKSFKSLRQDLEVHLGSPVEIVGIGEEKFTICIAVKTWKRPIIGLREVMESTTFNDSNAIIPIAAGMDVLGRPFVFDLAATPHLLAAGATGSGKSVFLNDLILSILFEKSPDEVKLILFDPKEVEFRPYKGIPHLLFDPIYDKDKAMDALYWTEDEMMKRYQKFSKMGVKNIEGYNEKSNEKMPRTVLIIDE